MSRRSSALPRSSRCLPPVSDANLLRGRRPLRRLRPQPGAVRRLAQGAGARRHRRAGPQRRRQVDPPEGAVRRSCRRWPARSASTAPQSKREAAERRVRRGIGYVPQEHAIFTKLTVRENLLLGCVRQPDRSGMDYVLDFFPKLAQRLSADGRHACRAASARCWRSAAPCWAGRSSSCSTSRPRACGSA